jgi:hypothetical protein
MSGYIGTAETNYYIGFFCKEMNNFAFSFITPLSANNYSAGHKIHHLSGVTRNA